jgi:hypothetical protein
VTGPDFSEEHTAFICSYPDVEHEETLPSPIFADLVSYFLGPCGSLAAGIVPAM